MLAHMPRLPARLHALQVPQLPALQQTPSAQKPLLHSAARPQVAPSSFFATQLLPLQNLPLAQSSSPLQLVRHVDGPQTYGLQLSGAAVAQPPRPLQCDTGWYVVPEHDATAQATEAGCCAQAPLPSHRPVLPHTPFDPHAP
jgi:hypothetical protein